MPRHRLSRQDIAVLTGQDQHPHHERRAKLVRWGLLDENGLTDAGKKAIAKGWVIVPATVEEKRKAQLYADAKVIQERFNLSSRTEAIRFAVSRLAQEVRGHE